jgi:heme-degrading monooxygenase HmoA
MILRMLSAFVPRSELEMYLEHLRIKTIPAYEAAAGLISVALVRRQFVEYVEVATISTWQSEEAMTRFLGLAAPIDPSQPVRSLIEWEAHIYEMVVARYRIQSDERHNPCPECKEGAD